VFVKSTFPKNLTLDGLRLVIDCGNGAAYKVGPEVLEELGAEVTAIGVEPDGENINLECGALHPHELQTVVGSAAPTPESRSTAMPIGPSSSMRTARWSTATR